MKKRLVKLASLLCLCLLSIGSLIAQSSYSSGNLAVFYPASYDGTQHQPSFAIMNEPSVSAGLPSGWQLIPSFYTNGSSQKCASLACGANVDFYGTGEVTGNIRRNNTSITLWNTDNYGYDKDAGKRLYQSHPWVLGVRADGSAFGVIADNTWKMYINISNTDIVFVSDGPAFRVLVFEGDSPQAVVEQLSVLTGKISLPPMWSLGYQQCRYSYMTDTEVKSVADNFRSKQLPCDVIWMDIDYMDGYKIFTHSSTAFPDPAGLNTYLHNKDFKSVWMIDPGVKKEVGYSIYDQGTTGNHWVKTNGGTTDFVGNVWPGPCVFPDYTRPETRTWWAGLYDDFMSTGVDGVWNDMNEPSVFVGGDDGSMPSTNWHRGGGTLPAASHLRYHNVYGMLMVEASREGIMQANPNKRPFVLSRSNYLGGQKFAATWTGDNKSTTDHMKMSVPMSLTMGLSGQPISGPDVGGYRGNATASLLGHWMALGTFYPFYRNHAEKGTVAQEPWAFGSTIEQVSRVALQRRYRLLPYLYTLTQEASVNGMPIMRPLFFAEPTNTNLRNQQEAFLLGDVLMVIPKWATGVQYPSGIWRSISLVGEDSQNDTYQPDVRVKEGSILPLGQIVQSTESYSADSLTLIVSLDADLKASGVVYNDAGDGYDYQSGQFLMRSFDIQPFGSDSLALTATVTDGLLSTSNNRYNVGVITDTGIVYTGWTSDNVIKIARADIGEEPLPVHYLSVNAVTENNGVKVTWIVENEVSMKAYEVQHSTDGIHFKTIRTIESKNSATRLVYTVLDNNPSGGNNLYRIKGIGLNGDTDNSKHVKVVIGNSGTITVSPNPITGNYINLQFTNQLSGRYYIKLFNYLSQPVYNTSISVTNGNIAYPLSLPHQLLSGYYQIEIINETGNRVVQKVIVQ